MNVKWTEPAVERLDEIFDFLKQRSEQAAVDLYNEILDEVDYLANFPRMAPLEPMLEDFARAYRSLVVRKTYKIVYHVDDDTIYISTVFDCRQSPDTLRRQF
jgi:plasmid stabilization system protein ParE